MGLKLNSKEGITKLYNIARNGGWVLNEYHEKIAIKYDIDRSGVKISRSIPL